MKYLKRYNEAVFVDKSPMKSDVEDILLELKDEGFETFVEISVEGTPGPHTQVRVEVRKESEFDYTQIEETIERVKHYMTDENFYIESFSHVLHGNIYTPDKIPYVMKSIIGSTKFYFQIKFKNIPSANEELKSGTYKSAADKLKQMGHVKRPEELMKWHLVAQEKEKDEAKRKAIEEASKLGTYKMTLNGRNGIKFTGDFYVYFYWNNDTFDENYEEWKRFDASSLWLQFDFAVLPASEESKEFSQNVLNSEIGLNYDGKCWLGTFGLNLTLGGNEYSEETNKETFVFKPNGGFYWEEYHNIDWYMSDRASAQKFKKMLYDVFEGNIVWRETPQLPGGVKEQILDFLCSDMDHTLEEFEEFIESIKRISVNKIYKD
jgi:hypothetical protein